MKQALLKIIDRQMLVLNNLRAVAHGLPDDDGPTPWHVLTSMDPGEIHYIGENQVEPVLRGYGLSDWHKLRKSLRPSIDYVKRMPNGVTVHIENAEAAPILEVPITFS